MRIKSVLLSFSRCIWQMSYSSRKCLQGIALFYTIASELAKQNPRGTAARFYSRKTSNSAISSGSSSRVAPCQFPPSSVSVETTLPSMSEPFTAYRPESLLSHGDRLCCRRSLVRSCCFLQNTRGGPGVARRGAPGRTIEGNKR